jgi:hypothetical protein
MTCQRRSGNSKLGRTFDGACFVQVRRTSCSISARHVLGAAVTFSRAAALCRLLIPGVKTVYLQALGGNPSIRSVELSKLEQKVP